MAEPGFEHTKSGKIGLDLHYDGSDILAGQWLLLRRARMYKWYGGIHIGQPREALLEKKKKEKKNRKPCIKQAYNYLVKE
jgi:hypothetical protein